MIVSHEHRYVFWQVPNTGCSAVASELCEHYGGEHVLRKHAHPNELLGDLPGRGRDYFLFATIRNPLDSIVTNYLKSLRLYSESASEGAPPPERRHVRKAHERARWATENDADFSAYFLHHYATTFFASTAWMYPQLTALVRHENLSQGLADVLRHIGLEPVRVLPARNVTRTKDKPWHEYYSEPARRRAAELFVPFLSRWGYALPDDWEPLTPPAWRTAELERIDRVGTRLVGRGGLLPRSPLVRAAVFAARLPTLLAHASSH